jgi:hypothetical protein
MDIISYFFNFVLRYVFAMSYVSRCPGADVTYHADSPADSKLVASAYAMRPSNLRQQSWLYRQSFEV